MKFTTALTLSAVLLTSSLGIVNRANAHQTQQESAREKIENVNQPQYCPPWLKYWRMC